jgi:peptide chain release factor 1
MLDKVKDMVARYEEIEILIQDPKLAAIPDKYAALMRERGSLEKVVTRQREIDSLQEQKEQTKALLEDPEMKEMAEEEMKGLTERENTLLSELEEILLTEDEVSMRSVIVEIRPGVGGAEAALFAHELMEMYTKFALSNKWKIQQMDVVTSDLGGLKYGVFSVEGPEVYKFLRYESGTHRVQRVPATEASGRVHTSTCTVAVMPQAETVEVTLDQKDIKIDTFSAGGPGGQHVNKTQSAIRITHLPTGIVVQCQNERSQGRNRDLAMRWLRARIYEHEEAQKAKERRDLRRSKIGTGDRSEKIRTYNFHDNRITDHRINFSVHRLTEFLEGEIMEMVEKLQEFERAEKLKNLGKK